MVHVDDGSAAVVKYMYMYMYIVTQLRWAKLFLLTCTLEIHMYM